MGDVWESISRNFIKWLLGVIAVAMVTLAGAGITFYVEWKTDEAAEDKEKELIESRMFDSPNQKEEIKDHVKEAPPALEQRLKMERDADFQKQVLEELRQMRKMDTINADQIWQIKQEVLEIERRHNN